MTSTSKSSDTSVIKNDKQNDMKDEIRNISDAIEGLTKIGQNIETFVEKKYSTGEIIGISIGAFFAFIILVIAVAYILNKMYPDYFKTKLKSIINLFRNVKT